MLAFTAASPAASALLMLAPADPAWLVPGRALAGIASGVVFAAGSAWMQELSAGSGAPSGAGASRTALALSAGFGTGPLVAGVIAALAPAPLVLAHVSHLIVAVVALALVSRVPETLGPARVRRRVLPAAARRRAFWRDVLPIAPWVFASASVSFAVLPVRLGGVGVAAAGAVTAGTLAAGIALQPLARRLSVRAAAAAGLVSAAAGFGIGGVALAEDAPGLLAMTVPLLGAAYGLLLVAGLRRTEAHAGDSERGAVLALFYALTYAGFAAPLVLETLARAIDADLALAAAAVLALGCLVFLPTGGSTHRGCPTDSRLGRP